MRQKPLQSFVRPMACIVLVVVGCSTIARERFKHWFFEIPDASASAPNDEAIVNHSTDVVVSDAAKSVELSIPPSRFGSVHPPYLHRQCVKCHNPKKRMQVRDNFMDACKTCHPPYFGDRVGHPPVVDRECITCHNMHRSEQTTLLRQPVFDTCIDCHDEPEDLSEPAHAAEGVENCVACHDPHFGVPPLLKTQRTSSAFRKRLTRKALREITQPKEGAREMAE